MDELSDPKKEAVQEFLKTFRIALNFITLYNKHHKSFLASVSDMKLKLDALLAVYSPLVLSFSPDTVSADGEVFEKKQLYQDISKQFHFRKIKAVQFSAGVSTEDLVKLMEAAALPVKDILKSGGMQFMLDKAGVSGIQIEELDYSSFLRSEGEISVDVWSYMLDKSMEKNDPAKILEFAVHFEETISHFKMKDLAENKQLASSIQKFLLYLHSSDPDVFSRCMKSLFRVLLKDRMISGPEDISVLSELVRGISPDDISEVVMDEASKNDEFNNSNLNFFLQALDKDRHDAVAESLAKDIVKRDSVTPISAKAAQKLKDLFTVSQTPLVSGIYKQVMETLSQDRVSENRFFLDRDAAMRNYRYILLFMLATEEDTERLGQVALKICSVWSLIVQYQGADYFKFLAGVLAGRRSLMQGISSLMELDLLFRRHIEGLIWEKEPPAWIPDILKDIKDSVFEPKVYIDKIFTDGKLNKHALELFVRFFPQEIDRFCGHLAGISGDIEFVGEVVEYLKSIKEPPVSLMLERIYGFSSDLIKIEVLAALRGSESLNEDFIMPVLSDSNYSLRKEAVAVIAGRPELLEKALAALFGPDDIWGRNNAVLEENVSIVEELSVNQAVPYLEKLAGKPFFWNGRLKNRAQKALEVLR